MMVRLLISYLLFDCKSFNDSSKSAATSADEDTPEMEPLGDLEDIVTSRVKDDEQVTVQRLNYLTVLQKSR